MYRDRLGFCILVLLTVLAEVPALHAQNSSELYGGYKTSDESAVDDEFVFGFRNNTFFSDNAAIEFAFGFSSIGLQFQNTELSGDLITLDISVLYYPLSNEFFFFGGGGWADADLDFQLPQGTEFGYEDSLTVNGGLGFRIPFAQKGYVRPEVRARWYEAPGIIDIEATLALGFGLRR